MGRLSPGPTRWPPKAERRLVPAKSNQKPQTSPPAFPPFVPDHLLLVSTSGAQPACESCRSPPQLHSVLLAPFAGRALHLVARSDPLLPRTTPCHHPALIPLSTIPPSATAPSASAPWASFRFLGTLQVHPRERLPEHPPPPALLHLRPLGPRPPRPVDQIAERVGPAPLLSPSRPPCPLHVADQTPHLPRPPTPDRPWHPPRRTPRIPPRQRGFRTQVRRRWFWAGAMGLRRPRCAPCSPLPHPAPLSPCMPSFSALPSCPFPRRRPSLRVCRAGVSPSRSGMTRLFWD